MLIPTAARMTMMTRSEFLNGARRYLGLALTELAEISDHFDHPESQARAEEIALYDPELMRLINEDCSERRFRLRRLVRHLKANVLDFEEDGPAEEKAEAIDDEQG